MINKAILVGNVGQPPRITPFDTGKVAQINLATNERAFTTANGVNVPQRTEWHNIVVRGGLADVVDKYITVGMSLYVEGKIRTRNYTNAKGDKIYITEIHAEKIEMLSSKKDNFKATGSDDKDF